MSGISGVGAQSSTSPYYSALSSGTKLQSAADGAAELSIAEKQKEQVNGYNAGSENIQSGKNALNIADSALSGVNDYLQRIRELAVKASNGLMSYSDKQSIQDEIDQMKEGISNLTSTTNYNGYNLIDGSNSSIGIVADGNGSTYSLSGNNSTLAALGIEDFDVTGSFDLTKIDKAISQVSQGRSQTGAETNSLDYALSYNSKAAINLTSSVSDLEDTEYAEYVQKLQKERTLETARIMMQRRQMEDKQNQMTRMFTF